MILRRYIAGNLLQGWLLVLLVLAAVFGLIGFIQELDHTRFDYNAAAVARYTVFNLPQQLVSLAPVVALLGSIVALANLDRSNELTIISCSGFSRSQLFGAIALPTLLLMAFLLFCMEYVTPALQQSADRERQALRYRNQLRIPDGGVWSKNGRRYIHLDKMLKGGVPGDISLYEFDESMELVRTVNARSAEVSPDRRWLFQGVRVKQLVDGRLVTRQLKQLEIVNLWAADELPTLTLASDAMTLSVLFRYSQYRAESGQPHKRYLGMFWQKLLMPLTVGAMVLLAMPISANLGARRDRGFGVSMAIGTLIGILFYLGTQITFALGQLLDLNVPMVAAAPALVIALCAILMLQRMRW